MRLAGTVRTLNELVVGFTQNSASESATGERAARPGGSGWRGRVLLWRALVAAGAAAALATGFLTAGHPYVFPILSSGTPSPRVRWVAAASADLSSSTPAVADGSVYVEFQSSQSSRQDDSWLYALNAANGHILWTYPAGRDNPGPTAANGLVYIGGRGGTLVALSAATGHVYWIYKTGSPVTSGATVAGGTVYFANDNGWMYALNAVNGHARWAIDVAHHSYSVGNAAVIGNTIYTDVYNVDANGYDKLYALNVANGHIRWVFEIYGINGPAVAGGTVYINASNNNPNAYTGGNIDSLYALNTASGRIRWSYPTDLSVTSPVVNDGTVYAGGSTIYAGGSPLYVGSTGKLYAFNAATGEIRWSYTAGVVVVGGDTYITSLAIGGSTVCIGGSDGIEYALNAANGSILWAYKHLDPSIGANPAVTDGTVYLPNRNAVYALAP